MRIGVMLRHYGQPGGIGVYTSNMLHALLEIDAVNQYVLIFSDQEHLGNFDFFSNARECVVGAPNKLWWDQIAVPLFARREKLDLIYNPKLSVPLLGHFKKVLVMHGAEQFAVPEAFNWHDRIYFSIANPIYCKRASAIISSTYYGAFDLINYMKANPAKIHVTHYSFNEECRIVNKDQALEARLKYRLPERFIFFIGGLNPLKNLRNLLKAYREIRDYIPHKLVITGFKRWKYSKDLALINQLDLNDDILFTGFLPDKDVPLLYNLADVFVFPSLYEGFGMPVLEAMACGCPVIATSTGCTPEVAGDAAFLVDPYNVQEISHAIMTVLSNEEIRKELREKGLMRARCFSWKKCAKETLSLFESLYRDNSVPAILSVAGEARSSRSTLPS